MRRCAAPIAGVLSLLLLAGAATGELPVERVGETERLPQPPQPHWAFVSDIVLRRSALLDLDGGGFLGMLSTGFLSPTALFSRSRAELYLPETYYSRGSRGARTDVVTIYDTASLAPIAEVVLPPKRAANVLPSANAALSDDDRFVAVFNMTPATSLSIVDVERRRLVGEIATPGCSLVYAAGPRRFFSLCANGAMLVVTLDAAGREAGRLRSEPFFDPETDPVSEKAVRWGDTWLFASFEGWVYPVDVSASPPRPGEPWSLFDAAAREDSWRVGGIQPLAVHGRSGRLFALVHRGGPDTHKEPGSELWSWDLASHERLARLSLRHPGLSFLSETVEVGRSWWPPFDRFWDWILDGLVPNPGLHQVQVTQDAEPLVVTGSQFGGSVAVYEADTGRFLRRVASGNLTTHVLQAPFRAAGDAP